MRHLLAAALILGLAACGQQQSGSADSGAPAAPSVLPPLTEAQAQPLVAALPAPYNSGDYLRGRMVFAQCRSCHTIANGGGNRVGPNLHGVVGRHIGRAPDFTYSQPVQGADFTWDADHLDRWIKNPQAMLPGTRMAFVGVRDDAQRRDVITFLMVESAR